MYYHKLNRELIYHLKCNKIISWNLVMMKLFNKESKFKVRNKDKNLKIIYLKINMFMIENNILLIFKSY